MFSRVAGWDFDYLGGCQEATEHNGHRCSASCVVKGRCEGGGQAAALLHSLDSARALFLLTLFVCLFESHADPHLFVAYDAASTVQWDILSLCVLFIFPIFLVLAAPGVRLLSTGL